MFAVPSSAAPNQIKKRKKKKGGRKKRGKVMEGRRWRRRGKK